MVCMINRWRAKIDWKEVYNVRDHPRIGEERKGAGGKKKEKMVAICMILETSVT